MPRQLIAAMSDLVSLPRTPSPANKNPRTPISPPLSDCPVSRTGRYLPEPYTLEQRQKRIDALVDRETEAQAREDELRLELSRLNHANQCLINRNSTLADTNAELVQDVAEFEERAQSAQDLQGRADEMQEQLEKLEGENTRLQARIDGHQSEMHELRKSAYKAMEDKFKLLKDQKKAAEDAQEEMRREHGNLLEEKAKEIGMEQAKVRKLEGDIAGMQAEHLLERGLSAEQVQSLESMVEAVKEEKIDEIKNLNLQISELQGGAEKHKHEVERLEAKAAKAESEKIKSEDAAEKRIDDLVRSLEQERRKNKDAHDVTKKEQDRLQRRISDVQRLTNEARNAANSADRQLKKVESNYQEDLVKLKQQISIQDGELKTLRQCNNSTWRARYNEKHLQLGKALADFQEAERCRGLERLETERLTGLLNDRNERITKLQEDLSREKAKHVETAAEVKKAREDAVKLKKTAEEDQNNAVKRLEAQKAAEKRANDLEAELQQAQEQNQKSTEATERLQAAEQEASDTKLELQAAESRIIALEQDIEDRDNHDAVLFELQQARHLDRQRRKRERSGDSKGDDVPEAKRLRPSPENWNPEDDPSF